MENEQAKFEGYAIVDVLGHQRYVGFVRTEAYGQAVMFRVDVPGLEEREYVLESPEHAGHQWCPAGTKVQRAATPGYTKLIGAGSIYSISPCSEAAAMKAVELTQRPELKIVELAPEKALPLPDPFDDNADADNDLDDEEICSRSARGDY